MKDSSKTKDQLIEELKELRGKLYELERLEVKHSEEALREAEEKFRTIFESSNDAISIIGESGVIDFNDAALRMMGYSSREGLLGTNPGDWSPPVQPDGRDSAEAAESEIAKAFKEGRNFFEWTHRRADGELFPAEVLLTPMQLGGAVVIQTTVRDITERKRAEEALVSAKARLQYLLTSSPAVIYTCDAHGNYPATYISENIEKQLGYTVEEFLKAPNFWFEHIHPDDRERTTDDLSLLFEQNSYSHEYRFLHKDGSYRWMHDELSLVRDSEGAPSEIVGSWIDITEHKQAEKEKEELQAQLIQAQKMEAVGIMAGGIAHDFNNILTVVKSMSSMGLRKAGKADKDNNCKKYLEPIYEVSKRAIGLIQQLLVFSQSKPAELTCFSLNSTIEDLQSMLTTLVSEDISIEKDLGYDLWNIEADKGRIEQVVTNLVVNSSNAMSQGGKITLRTENVTSTEKQSKAFQVATSDNFVCLTVEDTGTGMDKETIEHIFEPFFTTNTPIGTGLGLSIVYGIVKELKGWIDVSSEPGQGSKFRVYIPASMKSKEMIAGELVKKLAIDGEEKRILLVEDEKWVRKSTAMVLSDHGYIVSEASDAETAISLFNKQKGQFDLVLSDVVMPGKSGFQMVRPLLEINPNIPILFFSGYLNDKVQLAQIAKGGFAYIQKPYDIPDLLQTIEESIGGIHKRE